MYYIVGLLQDKSRYEARICHLCVIVEVVRAHYYKKLCYRLINWRCVECSCNEQVNYSEKIVTLVSQADLEGGRLH